MAESQPPAVDLDRLAWDILTDLLRQQDGLQNLTAEGLRRLIALRLEREAERAAVDEDAVAAAFDRALLELTGAGRPPREPEADAGPQETVDDL